MMLCFVLFKVVGWLRVLAGVFTWNFWILELVSASEIELKKGVADDLYLDYMVKDSQHYVTFMSTVKEDMEKVR